MAKDTPREEISRPALGNGQYAIRLPDVNGLDQDEEWCDVMLNGSWRRIRFHDYHEIYKRPGLYESIFYDRLQCCSPQRVVQQLKEVMEDHADNPGDLKVLDLGAGNGMVGEELKDAGVEKVVGVDIIPEAKKAALRDRPDVYEDYVVTDMTDIPEPVEEKLRKQGLNCLSTVAALGFGDIPAAAFLNALDLIDTPGWITFNIKEDFLDERDDAGFAGLIHSLCDDGIIRMEAYRRYPHRLAVSGKPLHYVAVVATKRRDVPDNYRDL
jgi:predicted TPR repeat methyltransferase